jgi:hypothetical protein
MCVLATCLMITVAMSLIWLATAQVAFEGKQAGIDGLWGWFQYGPIYR